MSKESLQKLAPQESANLRGGKLGPLRHWSAAKGIL
jgi:hypothetical protein